MRLGTLHKALTGAVLQDAAVRTYLRVRDSYAVAATKLAALDWAEQRTGLAIDQAVYTLPFEQAEADDAILMPAWHGLSISQPSGVTYDAAAHVAVLPAGVPARGTLTFAAGYTTTTLPAQLQPLLLYLCKVFDDPNALADNVKLPGMLARTMNAARISFRGGVLPNRLRPLALESWDATTGRMTALVDDAALDQSYVVPRQVLREVYC